MSDAKEQLVIGLTGSFGSGCSTLCRVLEQEYDFKAHSLSKILKEEWSVEKGKPIEKASRKELQMFGNQKRNRNLHVWAEKAFEKSKEDNSVNDSRLVYDSIRNTAEVDFFVASFRISF